MIIEYIRLVCVKLCAFSNFNVYKYKNQDPHLAIVL